VLLTGFPSVAFGTNCYVVAPAPGEECLVVDPGIAVVDALADVLREHRLKPAAVLLTHGHLDHTYSVTPVCGAHGVAAYVHSDDRDRLVDPLREFASTGMLAMLEQQFGAAATWAEPDDVVEIADASTLDIAGLTVRVSHAPGHTPGSVLFSLEGVPEQVHEDLSSTILTGDVLFAGSIGRTDLPGGDHGAMLRSLRERVLTQPDDVLVLPGHGPATTIGRERASNPFLRELLAS
jgi:glyoxylase-like metal-dependent hydrolase (beta-lactamase superfamily II)